MAGLIQRSVELRASFNALLAGAAVRVSASGAAGATLTGRSAASVQASGLMFVSATSQQPYEDGLPTSLEGVGSQEVLLGVGTWPFDGVGAGEEVLLERLEITPTRSGELTISLGTVAAATNRWARDGAPFEVASADPWRSSVRVSVESLEVLSHLALGRLRAEPGEFTIGVKCKGLRPTRTGVDLVKEDLAAHLGAIALAQREHGVG